MSRMTYDQLQQLLRRNSAITVEGLVKTHHKLSHPKPEPDKKDALEPTVQGKAESLRRAGVRFTLFRVRPLDPDNAAASCKDLLDGLVRAKILPDDAIWQIEFSVTQEKVCSYKQEKTVIELSL